jgi:thiol-disulfide isomerase/thioredoxin
MKFLFISLIIFSSVASAQDKNSAPVAKKLDENSIVRDSSGQKYSAPIWKALLNTGDYTLLTAKGMDNTDFILKRLTPEEKKRIFVNSPPPAESKYFTTGEKIKFFTERDIKGNKYKLKNMQGKIIVINFWFINCPPCRQEIPELNEMVKQYASNPDVVFLAIALDPKYDIETFLEKIPFDYNIIENGRYITDMYGIKSYPTHVVVDGNGIVRFHTTGLSRKTVSALKNAIDVILAKPVEKSNQ